MIAGMKLRKNGQPSGKRVSIEGRTFEAQEMQLEGDREEEKQIAAWEGDKVEGTIEIFF